MSNPIPPPGFYTSSSSSTSAAATIAASARPAHSSYRALRAQPQSDYTQKLHAPFHSSISPAGSALNETKTSRLYPAQPKPPSSTNNATRFLPPGLASLSTEQLALSPRDRLNALLNKPLESKQPRSAQTTPSLSPSPSLDSLGSSSAPPSKPLKPPLKRNPHTEPVLLNTTSLSAADSSINSPIPLSATSDLLPYSRKLSIDSGMSSSATTTPVVAPKLANPTSLSSSQSSTFSTSSAATASAATTTAPAQPSVATLIANAGSAEAALEKLLAEQKTQNVRSEQLWKLVEKQRTMLLGLNKDLERALKDKERYRKKLKELQAGSATGSLASIADAKDIQRSSSHNTMVSVDSSDSSHIATPRQHRDLGGLAHERTDSKLSQRTDRSSPPRQREFIDPPKAPAAKLPAVKPLDLRQKPTSPLSSPGEKRKNAPAPLDLTHAKPNSPIAVADYEDSESDYSQPSPAQVSPPVERGRRKTRADDDKAREDIAIEEEEEAARSRSSKQSKSKSKGKPAEIAIEPAAKSIQFASVKPPSDPGRDLPAGLGFGLPSSPRAPMLGGLQSPLQSSMGSIAGALHPPPNRPLPQPSVAALQQSHHMIPKSPGLPMSPRPGDRPLNAPTPRLPKEPLMSPGPMSPRSGLPLSPRAPRGPVPLPQSANPLAATTPYLQYAESASQNGPAQSLAERVQAQQQQSQLKHSTSLRRKDSVANKPGDVFRGFITDQYPGLLLPPNALPLIDIKIHSSRLRPSRQGYGGGKDKEDESILTLAVHSRSDNSQLWRVEKTLTSLISFNNAIKDAAAFNGKLPDRKSFTSHAPAHVDARRAALHEYFESLLETPMDDKAALIVSEFLSHNVIGSKVDWSPSPADQDSGVGIVSAPERNIRREGFLAKKGKQFGGWKSRYFVLEDGHLKYYEAPNGAMLGYIKLHRAQIAKQVSKNTDDDAEYRHAFAVLERRRRDSSSMIRHVLCAETDEDRDAWVNSLVYHIGDDESAFLIDPGSPRSPNHTPKLGGEEFKAPQRSRENSDPEKQLQSVSYDATEPGEAPKNSGSPSPTQANPAIPTISGPVSGGPIQNASAWGNKTLAPPTSKEMKKRSMFGFISRSSEDGPLTPKGRDRSANRSNAPPVQPVFGIPLAHAAEMCTPIGVDVCLPAPVYRCIEYLEAKNAASEEGIFRLSGSNVTVKALRDRFNTEGDVKLLDGPYTDIHAVAGVLKLYLRELPDTVLTKEMHLDFLKVLDLDEHHQKIAAINILVHRLPEPNHELLATLSRFLISVVSNSDVNKMNVRNVGIVFAPTLNIPAPLISLFLTDHEAIFAADTSGDTASTASPVLDSISASSPDSELDIRSPRKQMFSDLATPSYNQTSFAGGMMGIDRSAYDTGFVPVNQQQEAPRFKHYNQQTLMTQAMNQEGYGSLNAALSGPRPKTSGSSSEVSPDRAAKKGRRESALWGGVPSTQPLNISGMSQIPNSLGLSPSGSQHQDMRRKTSHQRLRETGLADVHEA